MPDIHIKTDSVNGDDRRADRKRRQMLSLLAAGGVVAGLAVIALIVSPLIKPHRPKRPAPVAKPQEPVALAPTDEPQSPKAAAVNRQRIADDGRTMWASPTTGAPISLAWLPPGCQLIVHARPASLAATGELDKVVSALGPRATMAIEWLRSEASVELNDVDSLTLGLRPARDFVPEWTIVLHPTAQRIGEPLDGVFTAEGTTQDNVGYFTTNDGQLVIATRSVLPDLRELDGNPPSLRRELEGVVAATDADRHLTVIAAPSFLFGEGRGVLDGERQALRDRLVPLLPDEIKAFCISMHWGDSFFAELMVAPTGGTRSHEVAKQLTAEINRWPIEAEDAVLGLAASDYGRRVVARLPAMLRALARYTRSDFERTHAVLRCYLPKSAGHSLLMAGELMTAYRSMGPSRAVARPRPASQQPKSLADRLAVPTTLTFSRDTLEMAILLLSQDTGIPMTINGNDLRIDGITKNQSFGIDLQNRPAGEILVEILRLANPDKSATSAKDPKHKLVYVVGPGDSIIVTTRAAAAKRGESLPAVFQP